MNTSKQINVMVLLVFAAVIATAAYTLWDPTRASEAKNTQLQTTITRGAFLFSQNCRQCHGNMGEGGQAANRLPQALILNRFDLQGRKTPNGPVDTQAKAAAFNLIVNTLTCGRVGKFMPAWSIAQGGTLTDLQIQQLATFITEGTAWDQANNFAIYGDEAFHVTGDASNNIHLVGAISATDTTLHLTNVTPIGNGSRLQIANEIMTVNANPDANANTVTVDRHLGTTKAVAHAAGDLVLQVPSPANPPTITGSSGPVCGQYYVPAPTPAAGGTPAATPTAAAGSTTLTLTAKNLTLDSATLTGVAGQVLTLTYNNQDAGTAHNIDVYQGTDATGTSVGKTDIAVGPVTQTLKLGPLTAGTYYYQCDVHPLTMNGVLTVQ